MNADKTFYPTLFKYDFDVHLRHFERYFEVIRNYGKCGAGETWLDCACGSGYGTRLLGEFCSKVVGYDIDDEAVLYARDKYGSGSCLFTSDIESIGHGCFDLIASIETIEHVAPSTAADLLDKMRSWLKQTGYLIITTPIVPKSNPEPVNPFHEYEYDMNEFCELLKRTGFIIRKIDSRKVRFTDGETKEQVLFVCSVS